VSLPKTLQRLLDDPRVDEILDERGDRNGYWVYLKQPYWNCSTETSCVHELTVAQVMHEMRHHVEIRPEETT